MCLLLIELENNPILGDLLEIGLTICVDIFTTLSSKRTKVPVVMRMMMLELELMVMYSFFWTSPLQVVWLTQDKSHDKITFL